MCPFYYEGKCILLEQEELFEKFEVYCKQSIEWWKQFEELSKCPFSGKDREKKCSQRRMYQDWLDKEKSVSRLENKGF